MSISFASEDMRDAADRAPRVRRERGDAGRESEARARARWEPVGPLGDAFDAFSRATRAFDVDVKTRDMRRDDGTRARTRGGVRWSKVSLLSKRAGERDAGARRGADEKASRDRRARTVRRAFTAIVVTEIVASRAVAIESARSLDVDVDAEKFGEGVRERLGRLRAAELNLSSRVVGDDEMRHAAHA